MKDESVVNVSINFKKWCTFARIAWNAVYSSSWLPKNAVCVCCAKMMIDMWTHKEYRECDARM